jgi:hypothetical protein
VYFFVVDDYYGVSGLSGYVRGRRKGWTLKAESKSVRWKTKIRGTYEEEI